MVVRMDGKQTGHMLRMPKRNNHKDFVEYLEEGWVGTDDITPQPPYSAQLRTVRRLIPRAIVVLRSARAIRVTPTCF